jgi:hypothetical protein
MEFPAIPVLPEGLPALRLRLLRTELKLSFAEMCDWFESQAIERGLKLTLYRGRISDWANGGRAIPDWADAIVIRELGTLWRKDRQLMEQGSAVATARDIQWASLFDPVLAAFYQVVLVIPAEQRHLLEPLREAIFADFKARFDFPAPSDS